MHDLVTGMRYLGKGQRWVAGHGRWWGFGLIPALISLVLYAAALTVLALWSGEIAAWATPFADDWGSPWQALLRGLFVVLLFAGGLMLSVLTFTAVTLLIGDPFYESLSEKVEESEGRCPQGPDRPLWQEIWIALRDSLHVLLRAAGFGILLFALGFVPVIGQTVIPAVGLCVSGFFLAVELTSVAMQRRDIPVRERLRLLRGRKALAIGFGTPIVLLFLIPFLAVILMPGAVAGATLLVRDLVPGKDGEVGESDEQQFPGGGESGQEQAAAPYGHPAPYPPHQGQPQQPPQYRQQPSPYPQQSPHHPQSPTGW